MDVASSASTPANHAASTSAAQSENAADAALKEAITSDATGAASSHAASADFSSFLTANKQQSPFALKAGGESTAFGSGTNGLTFGTAAGGFGALGPLTCWSYHSPQLLVNTCICLTSSLQSA